MLEARFQQDRPAPSRAQLEQDLRTKITAAMPRSSRLESIECRNALCRVRTTHLDPTTYQDYVSHVFLGQDETPRVWPSQVWIAVPKDMNATPIASSVYLGISQQLPP
jgi:hypothetical protein